MTVLLAKGTSLVVAVFLTALGVVVLLPDGNDYAEATRLKHQRLADLDGPKIVFVGGSNLAFGLASDEVARTLGRPGVYLGMNGYLGVRLMLEEVRASLRPGDVVVLAFEYDSYYMSVDGSPTDHLALVKANPALLGAMSRDQIGALLGQVPYAAQQKLLRLLREAVSASRLAVQRALGRQDDTIVADQLAYRTILAVESVAGFDEHGDLNSHVGVPWPYAREEGVDLTATPVDPEVVSLLQVFAEEMQASGVTVVLSYTPALDAFYARHAAAIEALHERLRGGALVVPSAPRRFVFAEEFFFDTVYHLNERGREVRTTRVSEDLTLTLAGGMPPAGPPTEHATRVEP